MGSGLDRPEAPYCHAVDCPSWLVLQAPDDQPVFVNLSPVCTRAENSGYVDWANDVE